MPSYDRPIQLAREGNALTIGIFRQCYERSGTQARAQSDVCCALRARRNSSDQSQNFAKQGKSSKRSGPSRGSKRAYYRMIDWMLWAAPFAFWGFLNRGLF